MQLPDYFIAQIASVIASRNPDHPNYMKGPELVNFFNSLGFKDSYVFKGGKGIVTSDIGESLSRTNYTQKRLSLLNSSDKLVIALQRYIDVSMNPEQAAKNINLAIDGSGLNMKSSREQHPSAEQMIENAIEKDNSSDTTKTDKLKKEKQRLIDETFGSIPNDRIVVFISYSWEAPEHQTWVGNLADKLTEKGFYVLFDQYNEPGVGLELFMELGIEIADKVIVIGTPTYKLKSLTPSGGASYEGIIIRNSVYRDIGTKKFITCLKEGSFSESFPSMISGKGGHDFSNEENFDAEFVKLCNSLLSKPARPRPALGPNPMYSDRPVKEQEELKYTDFRRENDVKWITKLFSSISINSIQRYLERSPEIVEDIVFESHDSWNRILRSIHFKIYQPVLRSLVVDFYSSWNQIVKLGVNYYGPSNIPNYYKFCGYAADVFQSPEHEKVFFAICEKMNIMQKQLSSLRCSPPQKTDRLKVDKKYYFCNAKTERDEEVKTFRQRKGKGCQIIGEWGDGGSDLP